MDERGQRSSFSNYGSWVDIAAPGSNILSTVLDGKYRTMSGTSMACPMVSGVLALFVSHKPHMTRRKVIDGLGLGRVSKLPRDPLPNPNPKPDPDPNPNPHPNPHPHSTSSASTVQ